ETQLKAERQHLDEAHRALDEMRQRAQRMYQQGEQVIGDAYSAERLGVTLRQRIIELADNPDAPLFFGRLDFDPTSRALTTDPDEGGPRPSIGRRHVAPGPG